MLFSILNKGRRCMRKTNHPESCSFHWKSDVKICPHETPELNLQGLVLYSQWPVTGHYIQPPSWPAWCWYLPAAPGYSQCVSSAFQTSPAPSLPRQHAARRAWKSIEYQSSYLHISHTSFSPCWHHSLLYFICHHTIVSHFIKSLFLVTWSCSFKVNKHHLWNYGRFVLLLHLRKILLQNCWVTQTRWVKISSLSPNSVVSWRNKECKHNLSSIHFPSQGNKHETST